MFGLAGILEPLKQVYGLFKGVPFKKIVFATVKYLHITWPAYLSFLAEQFKKPQ